ncbi:FK506-binding protein 4-like [Helicoverpa zea]|uniref:FK506-binding protein 4-like n=1 Tax=Helicoverpa zea TaxID=7113 RepID=UPI001F56F275|nr:FK506-binding protein 4-like [Helicoverpa zea]
MHLCLVSFQAILVAVLVTNHYYIDEVDAEKHFAAVGDWFNSMERKPDIQGAMNQLLEQIRTTADQVINIHRRMYNETEKKKEIKEEPDLSAHVNQPELAHRNPVAALDASGITTENDTETETTANEVTEKQEAPKKKRRTKKHKRKHKPKPRPKPKTEQMEEQPGQEFQDQKVETTTEKEIPEFPKRAQKKEHRRKLKKKFVKMTPKEEIKNASVNNSDSDEVKVRKPVDIIVHIKMNE